MKSCFALGTILILFITSCGAQTLWPPTYARLSPQHAPSHVAAQQPTPQTAPVVPLGVNNFKMLAPSTGWATTRDRLLWTADGGQHWKDISPPAAPLPIGSFNRFSDVDFRDTERGWVTYEGDAAPGHSGVFLASTSDGGSTWTTVSELPLPSPHADLIGSASVSFSDDLHGWVDMDATGGGYLYSTSDGGRTWQHPKAEWGLDVEIVTLTPSDAFFAGGEDRLLFVTHDAGRTIQEVELPTPPPLGSEYFPIYSLPEFATTLRGYELVNYRGPLGTPSAAAIFSTVDGGRTWTTDRLLSNLAENDQVDSGVAGSAWIVPFTRPGSAPATVTVFAHDTKDAPRNAEGTAPLRSNCTASFISASEGWARCDAFYSTSDGGQTWSNITPRARGGDLTTDPVTPTQTRTLKAIPRATLAKPQPFATALAASHPYSQQLAFDSTNVLTTDQMQTWWLYSPYYSVGVYLPGTRSTSRPPEAPTLPALATTI